MYVKHLIPETIRYTVNTIFHAFSRAFLVAFDPSGSAIRRVRVVGDIIEHLIVVVLVIDSESTVEGVQPFNHQLFWPE